MNLLRGQVLQLAETSKAVMKSVGAGFEQNVKAWIEELARDDLYVIKAPANHLVRKMDGLARIVQASPFLSSVDTLNDALDTFRA